jgi:hypothetical protein
MGEECPYPFRSQMAKVELRGCADRQVVSVYITDPAEMRDMHDLSEPCVARGFMLQAFAAGPKRVGCPPM